MLLKVMRFLVVALALGGLFVSVRALQVHNMDPGMAPPCAVSEKWDCGFVNHSRYAVFPPLPPASFDDAPVKKTVHIPVAAFGIAGYALIAIVALFGRWWIVLQLAEIAFGAAALLSYIEAFVLQKWCIYCVWSQGLATVILVATIVALVVRHREQAHGN